MDERELRLLEAYRKLPKSEQRQIDYLTGLNESEDWSIEAVQYRETENPLFAWIAFFNARRMKSPAPHWALEYLDACAVNLISLQREIGTNSPSRNWQTKVCNAIGLGKKGRGTPFTNFMDRGFWMAFFVAGCENVGLPKVHAIECAAKQFDVNKRTVERACTLHSDAWEWVKNCTSSMAIDEGLNNLSRDQ